MSEQYKYNTLLGYIKTQLLICIIIYIYEYEYCPMNTGEQILTQCKIRPERSES